MYRHGFGDCFLLSFYHSEDRVFTMLIDCGIKMNTSSKDVPIANVIDDLKQTLTPKGGKRPHVDVLVATHEHWDHVAYFHPSKPDYFSGFDIGQVWLAWTENPRDKEAATIKSRLRQGAAALQLAAVKLTEADSTTTASGGKAASAARASFNDSLNDVLGFYGASLTSEKGIKYKEKGKGKGEGTISLQTQQAMEHLIDLGKKGGGIKYVNPGTTVDPQLVPPGVNIFVLGPPKGKLINKSNPSGGASKETYLGIDNTGLTSFIDGILAMGTGQTGSKDAASPFGSDVGIEVKAAAKDSYLKATYFAREEEYRRIENNWLDIAGQLALQLDGAINNTSLVLAIELADSGKILLFPGDAQVGSWLSWHDCEWKVKSGSKTETRTAEDLLNNTVLYKVSHHGSHNATVKAKGLEMMTHPELVAMIPEQEKCYPGILYKPLMEELQKKCKGRVLVSADANHKPENLLKDKRPEGISPAEWKAFKENLVVDPVYVEYTVRS